MKKREKEMREKIVKKKKVLGLTQLLNEERRFICLN